MRIIAVGGGCRTGLNKPSAAAGEADSHAGADDRLALAAEETDDEVLSVDRTRHGW